MVLKFKKSTLPKFGYLIFLIVGLFVCSSVLRIIATTDEEFAFTEFGRWAVEEDVYVTDVTIDGDVAYVCTNDYLAILDVSDSTNPTLIQTFNEFGNYMGEVPWPEKVLIFGDYIFVIAYWHDHICCWTNKIMVLDVSDLSNPTLVQEFSIKILIYNILLVDNYLYVASYGEFRIFNVVDANAPFLIGSFSADGFSPFGIGIHDSYAFVGSSGDGYLVLDISNPVDPLMVKNCTDFSFNNIHFEGSTVYALTKGLEFGHTQRNFTVFNLAGSYNLVEINHMTVSEVNWNFIFSDGYIYMKTYDLAFRVLNATDVYNLEVVYQSLEEEFDAFGFAINNNDFYLAAGSEGLIIYQVNYPPITMTISQSILLIFIIELLTICAFLSRRKNKYS